MFYFMSVHSKVILATRMIRSHWAWCASQARQELTICLFVLHVQYEYHTLHSTAFPEVGVKGSVCNSLAHCITRLLFIYLFLFLPVCLCRSCFQNLGGFLFLSPWDRHDWIKSGLWWLLDEWQMHNLESATTKAFGSHHWFCSVYFSQSTNLTQWL